MSLTEKLLESERAEASRPCNFWQALVTQFPDDVENMNEIFDRKRFSVKQISAALLSEGLLEATFDRVRKHREGTCRCYRYGRKLSV